MKCAKGYFAILLIVLAITGLGLDTGNAYAQDLIWQSDWTVPQYLTLGFAGYSTSSSNVVFSPDGEIVLGAPSATQRDDQFERIEGNGTMRWSVNIGGGQGSSSGSPASLLANADGSAEVLASSGFAIAKINPDGSIAWSRSASSASALVQVSAQTVAVTDCNSISLINTNTGQTVWRYSISQPTNNCPAPIAIADGSGNIYAVYTAYAPTSQPFNGYRCLRLDTNGNEDWDVLASPTLDSGLKPVQPFGADSASVYINTVNASNVWTVVALQTASGSTAWTAPGYGLAVVPVSGDPIVSNATGIQRLSAANGQPQWTQAVSSSVAAVTDNDILLGTSGGLARLNVGTGATVWSATLPQTDNYGNGLEFVTVGEIAGPTVVAVLKPLYGGAPPVLEEVDFTSGQLMDQIPFAPSAQGVVGNSVLAGSNGIAMAAVESVPTSRAGGQLHVRMLNAATGSTLWETTDTSNLVGISPVWGTAGITSGGNTVAATVTNSYSNSTSPLGGYGGILADTFDTTTGALHWSHSLFDPNLGYVYSFNPMVDSSGNVFVTYGAPTYCSGPGSLPWCGVQSLVKLAAADGSVAWQFDNGPSPALGNYQVFPQLAVMQGSDVLLGGPFYGSNSSATLIRLSGIDGSTQWSAMVPSLGNQVGSIFPGGNTIIIVGTGWAAIDAATGQMLWANPINNSPACPAPCNGYANLRLSDDTILFGGENGGHANVQLLPAVQSGQAENFMLYPSEPSGLRSLVIQIVQDGTNRVWLEIHRHYRGGSATAAGVNLLAQFDPTTGQLLSEQALAPFDSSAIASTIQPLLIGAPAANKVLVQTLSSQPGAPDTTGNALLNTAITANGDLALTATAEPQIITAGQTLTFQFTAAYSGDAPISGAHLLAALPWSDIPMNVSCTTQLASNCMVNANSDTIRASFDMQPGGQVTISGQITAASPGGSPMLQGVVYGPAGLNESDTTNNFGYLRANDEIFKNGFE